MTRQELLSQWNPAYPIPAQQHNGEVCWGQVNRPEQHTIERLISHPDGRWYLLRKDMNPATYPSQDSTAEISTEEVVNWLRAYGFIRPEEPRPKWDAGRRELWYGGVLLKRYGRPADNQEELWVAFEAEGWPASIPSPFGADKDTLKVTLRHIRTALGDNAPIRISSDGTGEGVLWEKI